MALTRFSNNYSIIDRLVHNLAMGQTEVQKLLSGLEDKWFDKAGTDITAVAPVFITSLPRTGTTLLLELVAGTSDFASHTYRHMPFLLCPLTWDCISRRFQRQAQARQRAHGDGILVGYDSVEAFEEILWRAFWPDHFEPTRIRTWMSDEEDEDGEFDAFLRQHIRKIIGLGHRRDQGSGCPQRYVSKNNANIARLEWLERRFPDALILIPYRDPWTHVDSLIRQHQNFLKIHTQDAFALHYMETTGHLEFGMALRPINFDGWLDTDNLDPSTPDFWAEYWLAAFSTVLRMAGRQTVIFSYDRLCATPATGLAALESRIGLETGRLVVQATRIRRATVCESPPDITSERIRQMGEIHAQLDARALF